MKKAIFIIWQFTYGIIQSLAGLFLFLFNASGRHKVYKGAIVTEWSKKSCLSLGAFIFISKNVFAKDEIFTDILKHEYAHSIQSLILGPLYIFVIGIPSAIWFAYPKFIKMRRERGISYYTFYTERWAESIKKSLKE